jgi:hypothetical protein
MRTLCGPFSTWAVSKLPPTALALGALSLRSVMSAASTWARTMNGALMAGQDQPCAPPHAAFT